MTGSAGGYLRFLAWAAGVAVGLALVGWIPTQRLGGDGAVRAMLAGCAVSLAASAVGGVPIAFARRPGSAPAARTQALLMAMGLRFGLVAILGLAAVLSGLFDRAPLLLWVAVSYAAQLMVDTRYALANDDVEIR